MKERPKGQIRVQEEPERTKEEEREMRRLVVFDGPHTPHQVLLHLFPAGPLATQQGLLSPLPDLPFYRYRGRRSMPTCCSPGSLC